MLLREQILDKEQAFHLIDMPAMVSILNEGIVGTVEQVNEKRTSWKQRLMGNDPPYCIGK